MVKGWRLDKQGENRPRVQGQKKSIFEYFFLSIHRRRGGAGWVERVAADIEGRDQRRRRRRSLSSRQAFAK